METVKNLADACMEQMKGYPVVTGKDKLKRIVKQTILRQKLAPVDAFSWPNAMLAEGLLSAYETTKETRYLYAVTDYLNRWKSAGFPIHYVDNIMNGAIALWIEALISAVSGNEFSSKQRQELLQLCESCADVCARWLKNAAKTDQGILPYRSQHPDWLFADTLGMVCPFLCRYGAKNGDKQLLNLGVGQLQLFLKRGMDQKSGLPYHGYEEKTGVKLGIIGWGRACGWLLKGLTESLPWIPTEKPEYRALKADCDRLIQAIGAYQRPDGGFSWQMQAMEGHIDTSAEGMIGSALVKTASDRNGRIDDGSGDAFGVDLGSLGSAVLKSVQGRNVVDCSGECRGFAEYPQIYGSYPWGTGSVLRFLCYENCAVTKADPQ